SSPRWTSSPRSCARWQGSGVSCARRAALLATLLLAAALRFAGLGWGLRQPPHPDEAVFLDNVALMIRSGDLDHRYYQYPGLFFYMLYPLVRLLPHDPPGPAAYLAARALVAAFGVASCALAARLAREVASPRAGLLAALLLAVSPVAVETAHMVRPDVVLQALCLAVLIALVRAGVALAAFVLASPYAVLHMADFVAGVRAQVGYHYQERGLSPVSYPRMLLFYLEVWPKALGWPAVLLVLAALPSAFRAWRIWIPFLFLPATATAVLATSDVRHD